MAHETHYRGQLVHAERQLAHVSPELSRLSLSGLAGYGDEKFLAIDFDEATFGTGTLIVLGTHAPGGVSGRVLFGPRFTPRLV